MNDSSDCRGRDLIVDLLPAAVLCEEASVPEPPQMVGGGGRFDVAEIRQAHPPKIPRP